MTLFQMGYALVVGIANYAHVRNLPPTVVKDGRAVGAVLMDPALCGYPVDHVMQLYDAEANAVGIREGLRWLGKLTRKDDTAVFFFSGHGGRIESGAQAGNYLIPSDVDPQNLGTSAIEGVELTELLRNITAGRLLVLFDCCYSGGAGEVKDLSDLAGYKSGMAESYYDRLGKGHGRAIIASSRSDEQSLILPGMENSLFTYYLLAALCGQAQTRGDGLIHVLDVFHFVSEKVSTHDQRQHPILKAQMEDNFAIALHLGGTKSTVSGRQPEQSALPRVGPSPKYQAGRDIIAPGAERIGSIHIGDTIRANNLHIYFQDSKTQGDKLPIAEKSEKQETRQGRQIHILHLSDIHLGTTSQARKYRVQLEADLVKELDINQLDYLVISGDIATHSVPDEYAAGVELVDSLVNRFGLDSNRAIVVPGNHDLNWDLAAEAYTYIPTYRLPSQIAEAHSIPAGDAGVLLRNEDLYRRRFANFSTHFYEKVYTGKTYPLDYDDQGILHLCPVDRILFLAINSCWEIDHYYRQRAGINMDALSRTLDQLLDEKYDDWLKVAVWHHPVTGREAINDEFLQQLAVHRFKVCLHGHIHEAIEGYHKYDNKRGIYLVGAGTFGAPASEQVTGIPLQYNLLTINPRENTIVVETRKKEKPDGAWSADARWGDKNNPVSRYTIELV
jgi:predicted phosphodiesterase